MQKIKAIKFATSVNIGHSEELFLSEKKPVDVFFDDKNNRYLLIDHKTKKEIWVHTTNVQWCEPLKTAPEINLADSDKGAGPKSGRRAN